MGETLEKFEDIVLLWDDLMANASDFPCYDIVAICSTGFSLGLSDMEHWADNFAILIHHAITWKSPEGGVGSARGYGSLKECRRMLYKSCMHATRLVSVLNKRL